MPRPKRNSGGKPKPKTKAAPKAEAKKKANSTQCRWDDWVEEDRLRRWNEENQELAANLFREARDQQKAESRAKKAANTSHKRKSIQTAGSERASFRDSEDRSSSVAAPARNKRQRDWEIEKVSGFTQIIHTSSLHILHNHANISNVLFSRSSIRGHAPNQFLAGGKLSHQTRHQITHPRQPQEPPCGRLGECHQEPNACPATP